MPVDGLLRDPILADELLFRPRHSIIDQSLHAELERASQHGDGFGVGWYAAGDASAPAVFKSTHLGTAFAGATRPEPVQTGRSVAGFVGALSDPAFAEALATRWPSSRPRSSATPRARSYGW